MSDDQLAEPPRLEGSPAFVVATQAALRLLDAGDPARAALCRTHVRRISGLGPRESRRVGRAVFYGQDRRALTSRVDHAWVDRARGHCFVTPSVWADALWDAHALRRYAGILIHEAAHLYLATDDEAACNAEMEATLALLEAADQVYGSSLASVRQP